MPPDETSVTSVESSAAPNSSQPAPDPTVSVENAEERIPYERFQEELTKRQEAEQVVQQWNQWGPKAQAALTARDQENVQLRQQLQQQQATPPVQEGEDPVDTYVNDTLGRDEEGQKARKMLDVFTAHKVNKAVENRPTKEEVVQIVAAGQQSTEGRISSMSNVSNQIAGWVRSGMIASQDDAQKVTVAVAEQIRANPSIASRPPDMEHMVHSIKSRMQDAGQIARPLAEAPSNPLQPSGNGNGHIVPEKSTFTGADLRASSLNAFKNMDPDKLDAAIKAQEQRGRRI